MPAALARPSKARDLLVRYPEIPDGYDRLGMVHEAREHWREGSCWSEVPIQIRCSTGTYPIMRLTTACA